MKCFDQVYNLMPKAEIHCHLEGAIRTATIIDLAKEYNLPLPSFEVEALNQQVKVREQLKDLQSVLNAFAIAQNSIVSPAAVERIAFELFEDAHLQNIRLFELRFSPDWAFRTHHLDWDNALESILAAKMRAEQQLGMAIGLIAITSRSLGADSCEKTVDWAIRWRDSIHGIDLADQEMGYPIREFLRPVNRAKDAGLKVTIHSGEDTPAALVMETVKLAAPHRIGHGINIIEDLRVVEQVIERGITLEVNPWSNYLTSAVRCIEDHPLKRLFDLGVKVTINSDDPELLDTNLNNEYRIAHQILGMSMEQIAACNRFAVEASFLPETVKQAVMAKHFPAG